ncbi:hypothetical protein TSTA_058460 [Talaromyces stipitatus ATCC 10500]|uniref:Tetratricopeptide repeat domain protein n=1 Tax=Talaromyces stipitatus (strain ATCC 10500 / CBS 375.48 / QM 6759 / NRRL 1006) TaxID=441959 RepID=B8MQF6_TALSN|nr:uncharacterized protein TSTA_058460 [Talaromyces stipitatus ATCC 10500]EED13358.1 hypothetical protein TSTA_058460 [Talaromyces stipitatus ATCC 10500]
MNVEHVHFVHPLDLQAIGPERTFLLGAISLLGPGTHNVIYPSFIKVLSKQNRNDMKLCPNGTEIEMFYPDLLNDYALQLLLDEQRSKVYRPMFNRASVLQALAYDQKIKVLTATAKALHQIIPDQNGEDTTYDYFEIYIRHYDYVLGLATNYRTFERDELLQIRMPVEFGMMLRNFAGFLREVGHNENAVYLAAIGLKIIRDYECDSTKMSTEASEEQLDQLKAHFLSIRGYAAIRACQYNMARESLEGCIEIRRNFVGLVAKVDLLLARGHLAYLLAAEGKYSEALDEYKSIFKKFDDSDLMDDYAKNSAIQIATMIGILHTIKGNLDQAQSPLTWAGPTTLNPIRRTAVEHALGNLRLAEGKLSEARKHFMTCKHAWRDEGTCMHHNKTGLEYAISTQYKLAIIDVRDTQPGGGPSAAK